MANTGSNRRIPQHRRCGDENQFERGKLLEGGECGGEGGAGTEIPAHDIDGDTERISQPTYSSSLVWMTLRPR